MNAPETLKPATDPINIAHEVLMKSDEALCVDEVARAIFCVDRPKKADLRATGQMLKQLADLGMIEMEPRAGGVPFYRLIAAPQMGEIPLVEQKQAVEKAGRADIPPPQYDPASVAFPAAESSIPTKTYPPETLQAMISDLSGDSEGGETDAPAWASDPALQYLAPEDYEMPPADPVLLASANRELCHQLSHIAATCAEYLPDPSDITTVRAVEIMDMLIDAQRAHADSLINAHVSEICEAQAQLEMIVFEPFATSLLDHAKEAVKAHQQALLSEKNIAFIRDHTINQLRMEAGDLRERLDAVTQQSIADTVALTEKNAQLAADLVDMTRERDLLKAENLALKTSEGATPGFSAELQALRTSHTNAINEADRLRAELATERQAREALQEQSDAVDVKDAAVGYLVRVPKRAPILRRKPESARSAALSAVRAGAKRADVLAVVPVGTARRGAEWQSTEAGG